MKNKKNKSTRGGARQGAGRKKTGITTVSIGFTVHKNFAEVIKETVRAKVKELKEGTPKLQDLNQNTCEVKPVTDAPTKTNRVIKTQGNDYLERRRNAKLKS